MYRSIRSIALSLLVVFVAACGPCSDDTGEVPDDAPEMVLPDSIEMTAAVEESDQAELSVENIGDSELSAQFNAEADWLGASPSELSVSAGGEGTLTVHGDCGEDAEVRSADLVVTSNDPRAEETAVAVELTCEDEDVAPGALTVTIAGLPGGVDGDVSVEGPGDFHEELDETTELDDLMPGTYAVSAEAVEGDDEELTPEPAQQTVEVESEETAEATVTYGVVTVSGSLEIVFGGLPEGASGEAQVEGPDGFSTTVEGDETLAAVAPGTYDIMPEDVDVDSVIFEAEDKSVEVEGDETTRAEIDYVGPPGEIQIEVANLPDEAEATIELLDDEDELVDEFPGDGLLTEIAPGDYTVAPQPYDDNGETYTANDVEVSVAAGETAEATVTYSVQSGTLEVTVSGLVDNDDHDIDIINEDDTSTGLPSGGTVNLPPGTYTVVPNPVSEGLDSYEAEEIEDVVITSNDTTELDVEYELVLANFVLDSSELPDELQMRAEVTSGPDEDVEGFEFEGDGPHQFSDILPGVYEVDFKNITDSSEDFTAVWQADPSSDSYDVPSGETVTAETEYNVEMGSLTVAVDLPQDIQVEDGETYGVEFQVLRDGETVETFSADGPTTEDYTVVPGAYEVSVEEPYTDKWGNEFVFEGLDAAVNLSSDGDRTIEVGAPHPTQVTSEEDDAAIYGSLRAIIDRVEAGTEITFASNVETIVTEETLELTRSVSILGDASDKVLLMPEADEHRLFAIATSDGEAQIAMQGLQLEAGNEGNGDSGGAIAVLEELEELTLSNLHLNANHAEHGGAIAIDADVETALFEELEFVDNSSADQGGALAIRADAETITVVDCEFENNSAQFGGALFVNGAEGMVIVDDVTFSENTSSLAGGALFSDGGMVTELYDATFESNESTDDHGGAIATGGTLFAYRLTAQGNSADLHGGALWVNTSGDVTIDEAYFEDNDAALGGAVYAVADGELDVRRALFEDNTAVSDGGGAYLDGNGYLENTTFSGNNAGDDGGGLFFSGGATVELRHSTVVENSADSGQGIWTDDTENAFLRATYINNNGSASGQQIEGPAGIIFGIGDGAPINSLGHNFVSEVGDYFDDDDTDIVGESSNYGDLEDLGGFTATHPVSANQHGHLDIDASDCRSRDDGIMSTDQRGFPRPSGAECSRGAWEADAHIEDFENADFDETHSSGTFDGVEGRIWNYSQIRSAGDFAIDEEGARSESDGANVSSTEIDGIDGDVESFSVQFRKAGDDDNSRRIRVQANGSNVASSDVIGEESGEDDTIYVLEIPDFDEGSTFELTIENDAPQGTGDVTIDNVTWR